jgi:hypothetical protein
MRRAVEADVKPSSELRAQKKYDYYHTAAYESKLKFRKIPHLQPAMLLFVFF